MLFNSLHFILLFFPVAVTGYYLLPHRFRWLWLLVLSAYFYMSFVPYYILILAVTILVDYAAGLVIFRTEGAERRMWLTLSIVANVSFLAFFKYFGFLRENLIQAGRFAGFDVAIPALSIVLPIGLSFHTFQSMSYTIEVYRGNQEPERHLGIFALYVLFFPQLVAGPIERPQNLLHQFRERHFFDYDGITSGLKLIVWGLFQKMVIADRLAVTVDRIYAQPEQYGGLALALGTVLFAVQIFCDFAGYSDVAIGTAQVLGFKLMTNFRQPYLARSVAEFWKRWHISLSTWFRDYLYLPLGGNRCGRWRQMGNVLLVFAVSGLWHGADWKFVIWGALNGAFVVMAGLRPPGSREEAGRQIPVTVRRLGTFGLVCLTWIFFRAGSVGQAFTIIGRIFSLQPGDLVTSIGKAPLIIALGLVGVAMLGHAVREGYQVRELISRQPVWLRWSVYTAALTGILLLGEFHSRDFIYFQF
jgi:D-alanyl-lipoteichoic acid acyltransferase DltB (MBOAT superfamily)